MKIDSINIVLAKGEFIESDEFKSIIEELKEAVISVCWCDPYKFRINPIKKEMALFQ